jgi:hypothetical protein
LAVATFVVNFCGEVFGNIQNLDEVKAGVMAKCRFTLGGQYFHFCFYGTATSKSHKKIIF